MSNEEMKKKIVKIHRYELNQEVNERKKYNRKSYEWKN